MHLFTLTTAQGYFAHTKVQFVYCKHTEPRTHTQHSTAQHTTKLMTCEAREHGCRSAALTIREWIAMGVEWLRGGVKPSTPSLGGGGNVGLHVLHPLRPNAAPKVQVQLALMHRPGSCWIHRRPQMVLGPWPLRGHLSRHAPTVCTPRSRASTL